jgi:uncharacterized protein YdhG (YjbR/CyaY superfamily)
MPKKSFKSVEEYISAQPDDVRAVLRRVRSAVRKALPDGEEAISYQIPCLRLGGRPVLYFAGWKEHYSIYPATDSLIAALPELAPFKVSKGTLRFPISGRVPVRLIERLAKLRAASVVSDSAAQPGARRRRG